MTPISKNISLPVYQICATYILEKLEHDTNRYNQLAAEVFSLTVFERCTNAVRDAIGNEID